MMDITYKEEIPGVETLVSFFDDAGYFPIRDRTDLDRIEKMFRQADVVIAAWDKDLVE